MQREGEGSRVRACLKPALALPHPPGCIITQQKDRIHSMTCGLQKIAQAQFVGCGLNPVACWHGRCRGTPCGCTCKVKLSPKRSPPWVGCETKYCTQHHALCTICYC